MKAPPVSPTDATAAAAAAAAAATAAADERVVASGVFTADLIAPAAAKGEDAPVPDVIVVDGAGNDRGEAVAVAAAIPLSLSGCRNCFLKSSIHLYAGCFSICRSRSAFVLLPAGRPFLR